MRELNVDYRQAIRHGLDQLALTYTDRQLEQLEAYLALLHKWNRAYNLTAVRDPQAMIGRHLLDSVAIAPWLCGERFADVGTGAGLPGIPLAILFPERQFELIDSNGKKIRFVTQVIAELNLRNTLARQCRVEDYQPQQCYDAVTSRAYASLAAMAASCSHLLVPGGRLLALKGLYPSAELSALPEHYTVEACQPLRVPGEIGERHLVIIQPQHSA